MRGWTLSDEKAEQAWDYIAGHVRTMGYPPTMREIAHAMGHASPASATQIIESLESRGWISRSLDRRRIIYLTREEEQ